MADKRPCIQHPAPLSLEQSICAQVRDLTVAMGLGSLSPDLQTLRVNRVVATSTHNDEVTFDTNLAWCPWSLGICDTDDNADDDGVLQCATHGCVSRVNATMSLMCWNTDLHGDGPRAAIQVPIVKIDLLFHCFRAKPESASDLDAYARLVRHAHTDAEFDVVYTFANQSAPTVVVLGHYAPRQAGGRILHEVMANPSLQPIQLLAEDDEAARRTYFGHAYLSEMSAETMRGVVRPPTTRTTVIDPERLGVVLPGEWQSIEAVSLTSAGFSLTMLDEPGCHIEVSPVSLLRRGRVQVLSKQQRDQLFGVGTIGSKVVEWLGDGALERLATAREALGEVHSANGVAHLHLSPRHADVLVTLYDATTGARMREISFGALRQRTFSEAQHPRAWRNIKSDTTAAGVIAACMRGAAIASVTPEDTFAGVQGLTMVVQQSGGDVNAEELRAAVLALPATTRTVMLQALHGLGKTKAIAAWLQRECAAGVSLRVLNVSHIRKLIKKLVIDLGLESYMDERDDVRRDNLANVQRLSICINSLLKLQSAVPYDVVILDEVEALLKQLSSDLLAPNACAIACLFDNIVRDAKLVICADADLSKDGTFRHLSRLRPQKGFLLYRHAAAHAPNTRTVRISGRVHLRLHMIATARHNHTRGNADPSVRVRCVVVSNNRAALDEFRKIVAYHDQWARVLVIDSKVGWDGTDPNEEWCRVDYLFLSPAAESGLSFTRPHFSRMLVLATAGSSDSAGMRQLMCRVRAFANDPLEPGGRPVILLAVDWTGLGCEPPNAARTEVMGTQSFGRFRAAHQQRREAVARAQQQHTNGQFVASATLSHGRTSIAELEFMALCVRHDAARLVDMREFHQRLERLHCERGHTIECGSEFTLTPLAKPPGVMVEDDAAVEAEENRVAAQAAEAEETKEQALAALLSFARLDRAERVAAATDASFNKRTVRQYADLAAAYTGSPDGDLDEYLIKGDSPLARQRCARLVLTMGSPFAAAQRDCAALERMGDPRRMPNALLERDLLRSVVAILRLPHLFALCTIGALPLDNVDNVALVAALQTLRESGVSPGAVDGTKATDDASTATLAKMFLAHLWIPTTRAGNLLCMDVGVWAAREHAVSQWLGRAKAQYEALPAAMSMRFYVCTVDRSEPGVIRAFGRSDTGEAIQCVVPVVFRTRCCVVPRDDGRATIVDPGCADNAEALRETVAKTGCDVEDVYTPSEADVDAVAARLDDDDDHSDGDDVEHDDEMESVLEDHDRPAAADDDADDGTETVNAPHRLRCAMRIARPHDPLLQMVRVRVCDPLDATVCYLSAPTRATLATATAFLGCSGLRFEPPPTVHETLLVTPRAWQWAECEDGVLTNASVIAPVAHGQHTTRRMAIGAVLTTQPQGKQKKKQSVAFAVVYCRLVGHPTMGDRVMARIDYEAAAATWLREEEGHNGERRVLLTGLHDACGALHDVLREADPDIVVVPRWLLRYCADRGVQWGRLGMSLDSRPDKDDALDAPSRMYDWRGRAVFATPTLVPPPTRIASARVDEYVERARHAARLEFATMAEASVPAI